MNHILKTAGICIIIGATIVFGLALLLIIAHDEESSAQPRVDEVWSHEDWSGYATLRLEAYHDNLLDAKKYMDSGDMPRYCISVRGVVESAAHYKRHRDAYFEGHGRYPATPEELSALHDDMVSAFTDQVLTPKFLDVLIACNALMRSRWPDWGSWAIQEARVFAQRSQSTGD